MDSKLFLIEGLPCTGKSTTAKFIAEKLKERGLSAFYYDEGDLQHPADYEYCAYMTDDDLQQLNNEEQQTIKAICQRKCSGYLIPLSEVSEALSEKVSQYKIYDCLPWRSQSC